MKVILSFVVFSLLSFSAFSQTTSNPADTSGTTDSMDSTTTYPQEEVYQGDQRDSSQVDNQGINEPSRVRSEDDIQEEEDSRTNDTMRSDTMEGTDTTTP